MQLPQRAAGETRFELNTTMMQHKKSGGFRKQRSMKRHMLKIQDRMRACKRHLCETKESSQEWARRSDLALLRLTHACDCPGSSQSRSWHGAAPTHVPLWLLPMLLASILMAGGSLLACMQSALPTLVGLTLTFRDNRHLEEHPTSGSLSATTRCSVIL